MLKLAKMSVETSVENKGRAMERERELGRAVFSHISH